jgi:aryl-alcohol dehydrogenase-like predicted oxidoreductase
LVLYENHINGSLFYQLLVYNIYCKNTTIFKGDDRMEKIIFGQNNDEISTVCLGTMLMGTKLGKEDSFKVLDHFTSIGGNFIDTANCYSWWIGNGEFIGDESEAIVGDWMQERKNRDKVFLATKFGGRLMHPHDIRDKDGNVKWDMVQPDYEGLSSKSIRQAIEGSLKRLKTDYIDLYYVHIDDVLTPIEEIVDTLGQLVKEGKVKNIGCSNWYTWKIANARLISKQKGLPAFTAIQQEYSYIHPTAGKKGTHADDELFDYLSYNPDMLLMAYSPLLKGIYESEEKCRSYYNWPSYDNGTSRERLQLIYNMAKEMGVSGNQLVLAWFMKQQPRIIPILGFSKESQYMENISALDIKLSEEQLTRLNRGRL